MIYLSIYMHRYMVLFLLSHGFMDPAIKVWKWVCVSSLLPLAVQQKMFASCPQDNRSSSSGLEVLFPKKEMLSPGDKTMSPLNGTLRLLAGHFGLPRPLNQQGKKGCTVLAAVTEPDGQRQIEFLLQKKLQRKISDMSREFLDTPVFRD